jgi:hypothetical protein
MFVAFKRCAMGRAIELKQMIRQLLIFPVVLASLAIGSTPASPAPKASAAAPITVMDVDGNPQRPLELAAGNPATVIIFIDSECPICNAYAGEINRLAADYGPKKIQFYVAYTDSDLTAAAARKQLKDFAMTCAAVLDPSLQLAGRLDASVTPEAFVVGKDQTVLYHGRIDDLYAGLTHRKFEATQHDLRDALDAVLAGKDAPPPRGPTVGCAIAFPGPATTQP